MYSYLNCAQSILKIQIQWLFYLYCHSILYTSESISSVYICEIIKINFKITYFKLFSFKYSGKLLVWKYKIDFPLQSCSYIFKLFFLVMYWFEILYCPCVLWDGCIGHLKLEDYILLMFLIDCSQPVLERSKNASKSLLWWQSLVLLEGVLCSFCWNCSWK